MIYVNSCGHDSHHPKPCNIEHKRGVPDYLILLIKRESWIYLDGEKHTVAPNSLICFPPDTYIHYGCDAIGYNDDWIHFLPDAQERDIFLELLPPFCQILHPYNFHRLSEYVRMLSDIFTVTPATESSLLMPFCIFPVCFTGRAGRKFQRSQRAEVLFCLLRTPDTDLQ